MKSGKEKVDSKGRLVRLVKSGKPGDNTQLHYYLGRDAEGIIFHEGDREYIEVGQEKRYWGGIIDPLPDDPRIQQLREFTVFIIKPDGMKMEMGKAVSYLIGMEHEKIVAERDFVYDDAMIRRMYPHFFAEAWEQDLFTYLKSGISRCFLVRGKSPHRRLLRLRNSIRELFGYSSGPRVKSLVHCAQRQSDAIKQALLFFTLDEIVELVGLKLKH